MLIMELFSAAYADQHLTGKHQNQDVYELFQVMLNLFFPERRRTERQKCNLYGENQPFSQVLLSDYKKEISMNCLRTL